jgi:hypothetical protein
VLESRLEHLAGLDREHSTGSLIRDRQRELERRSRRTRPLQRCADVVQLPLDPSADDVYVPPSEHLHARSIAEEELCVPFVQQGCLPARLETLPCVLAKGLEQDEPKVGAALLGLQQAAFDQAGEPVHEIQPEILCRTADRIDRLQSCAPREDGEPREQMLLRLLQKLVAPVDGGAERSMPVGRIAGAALEQRERALHALEERGRREDSRARRRELERKWQSVQRDTHLCHGVSVAYRELESRSSRAGAFGEEHDRG